LDLVERFRSHGLIKIPAHLEIEPESGGDAKVLLQAEGSAGGHATTLVDNFVDALVGHLDRGGEFALGDFHGLQEFFQ
jgi:hypothetical protein